MKRLLFLLVLLLSLLIEHWLKCVIICLLGKRDWHDYLVSRM